MATISVLEITPLNPIKSEHLLRIIKALNGVASNDIIISGQLSNGNGVSATGRYAHAEGEKTTAAGDSSHAEGINTTTTGDGAYSHAEGDTTTSKGLYSHAEGSNTTAEGESSHAEGYGTLSSGKYSHAEGYFTTASGNYQHVQGQYNRTSSADSVFIHGNGTSNSNRSNLIFASGSQFQVTGSLLVTGSNTLIGTKTITGSVFISGSKTIIGTNTITGSLNITGSTTINNILTLVPTSSLPTGQPTGSFIVSGSGANCKPYFYNGTTWTALF
ncbi:hypothetical protein N9795_00305 [Candidatus Pelagibacter sp.]|nr:hypothetical protein [Candidatus Pelagibacter sp.]